jgi:hypothetical protein
MPKIVDLKDARSFLGQEVAAAGTVLKPGPDDTILYLEDPSRTSLEVHLSGELTGKVRSGDHVVATGLLTEGPKHSGLFRPVLEAKSIQS